MSTTPQPTAQSLPLEAESVLQAIEQREMALPALLFLASHRPLAFVLGQMLFAAAPMADLLGWAGCADWADILSDPDGPSKLEMALQHGDE